MIVGLVIGLIIGLITGIALTLYLILKHPERILSRMSPEDIMSFAEVVDNGREEN